MEENKLDKQYVTKDIALTLKELGFDEPCTNHWERGVDGLGWGLYYSCKGLTNEDLIPEYKDSDGNICGEFLAPLWQQVFDWFQERKLLGLMSNTNNPDIGKWCFDVHRLPVGVAVLWQPGHVVYDTYDEAKVACIEKMCEIIKYKDGLWECTTTDSEGPTSTDS